VRPDKHAQRVGIEGHCDADQTEGFGFLFRAAKQFLMAQMYAVKIADGHAGCSDLGFCFSAVAQYDHA
jgi:hypothetical protein